jgi:arabinose-5-phosphate isomerase
LDNLALLQLGKNALLQESKAIEKIAAQLNDSFVHAIKLIAESKGRTVFTGIGKSANIAQKIVATFNSTGSPALFMHAADAVHGDLGNVLQDDVVVFLSKSGETPEIRVLLSLIRQMGNKSIAICGNKNSELALSCHVFLDTTVEKEACPNNLAPTTSTTAQLAMGDALAVTLLSLKGFAPSDFAQFHPGGSLGKRLYATVGSLISKNEIPAVDADSSIEETIIEISSKRLGATAVIREGELIGVITDGDIRRMLQKGLQNLPKKAGDLIHKSPITIDFDELAAKALELMQEKSISQLLVTKNQQYAGVLHLHDLIREGII